MKDLPEEKLLRLIRGQKIFHPSIEKKPLNESELAKIRPTLAEAFKQISFKNLSYLQIQKGLLSVFILSSVYLASSFIYPFTSWSKLRIPEARPEKFNPPDSGPNIELKPYEFYLAGIRKAQIFKNALAYANNPTAEKSSASVTTDVTKDINLIGVMTGENLQAIIEDKKTQKTYYVTKGQFIGEAQVEEIKEDKIIINHKGQRIELYL